MAPREQDSIPTEAIGTPSFKIFGKAMEIPIVNDAIQVATKLHTEAVTYPYVNQVETIIGGLVTKAEDTITPHVSSTMTSTVTSTATKLDTLACTGLDQVTGKVPALKLPTGELATCTLNLVNTIQDYVAKFTVVRVLLTAFGMVLGFSIKGLETVLGLLEGKAEMSPATITGVVKPVLGHINTFKLLLEEIVKRSKLIDVTKPVEELREETHEVEELREETQEELREETHEEELRESHEVEELREETHEVELREETHEVELREETHEEELREESHEVEELREETHKVEEELEEDSEKELEEDSEKELEEDSEEELGEDSRRLTNRK